jgi:hypothetical protein
MRLTAVSGAIQGAEGADHAAPRTPALFSLDETRFLGELYVRQLLKACRGAPGHLTPSVAGRATGCGTTLCAVLCLDARRL